MTDRSALRLRSWLLADTTEEPAGHQGPFRSPPKKEEHKHPWWKVMCLTGVDYFSTLGYQPGIAALAAGVLSRLATLVLVALTLLGTLPVYRRFAAESPRGAGSIAMLAKLLPRWGGKTFVLVLLGFAATDFIITMTLSAADGAAHVVENPFAPSFLDGRNLLVTLVLLAMLAAVFLTGFSEAIGIAVALVATFLALNLVVVVVGFWHVATSPSVVADLTHALTAQHGSPWAMISISLLVFPTLALGMSGFEAGVAVMPQITGDETDTPSSPRGRIRGARHLLTTSALIMSGFLIVTSFVTIVLIPEAEFEAGGQANGRALSYLAHEYLGNGFGTVYDVSTIAILWFAGASAMAGLLNLVPRYLPRFGMAPDWARAVRPLVLVIAMVAFAITRYLDAGVDVQGAAYATGVLVLITSAAVAVTITARRRGQPRKAVGFAIVSVIFLHTTVVNVFERPGGRAGRHPVHHRNPGGVIRVPVQPGVRVAGRLGPLRRGRPRHHPDRHPRRRSARFADYRAKPRNSAPRATFPTPNRSCSWRSTSRTRRSSRRSYASTPGSATSTGSCGSTAQRSRTPSPRFSSTSGTGPGPSRTCISTGPRETRSRTCCGSCSSARARWRRSPARCCAGPSRTCPADRTSTSGRGRV